ncbi:hypothetical protein [uncultured Algoriphagus sp.]|uniref:hypothetical protein n=1 Tax=uncultured Algoriphagus sp. TaxID=417365 RepID=UPI0030EF1C0C|tara:strand:- start:16636 stop:17088 length:453 start_codon:yes stop_codon:yes gene_type:complete
MKLLHSSLFFLLFSLTLFSCNESEEPKVTLPDGNNKISGDLEIIKKGTFIAQSGSNTKGTIELGSDDDGEYYLRLSDDFNSNFHTGTVTVYLSTSSNLMLSETTSYQLVAVVDEGGEHYFKLPNFPNAKFSHGILWCGAAAIPFGFAELK